MNRFEQQILAWQRKAEAAMTATLREAAQDMTEEILRPQARSGRMPVDTGFLRNSFVGAVNSIPSGPTSGEAGQFDMNPLILAINQARIGDRIVIGTAAVYARAMEGRYAYLRGAVQNWPHLVDKAARKVRREIG